MEHAKLPVRAGEAVAVGKAAVGGEGKVQPLARAAKVGGEGGHARTACRPGAAEGQDLGPGGRGKARREGGVVAVGVGHDDGRHAPALRRLQDRGQMGVKVGAGVDHGKVGVAEKVGVGARAGQGRGVCGAQALEAGGKGDGFGHGLSKRCAAGA